MQIKLQIIFSFFFFHGVVFQSVAQKYDYNWMRGQRAKGDPDYMGNLFNFNKSPVEKIPRDAKLSIAETSTTMSNTDGNLLFYTNGDVVVDKYGNLMKNGDKLSPDGYSETYRDYGFPHHQGIMCLPIPDNNKKFMLFHYPFESIWNDPKYGSTILRTKLLTSVVDINLNNGLGEVVDKNSEIISDTMGIMHLTACKHANGRDWWILVFPYFSDSYYRLLLSPTGIKNLGLSRLTDTIVENSGLFFSCFTNNGEKYVRYHAKYYLKPFELYIHDFDRCTGYLSNRKYIPIPIDSSYLAGLSISSNSQFVYAIKENRIWQLDLNAQNIEASMVMVAEYDGTKEPWPLKFYAAQLAPDGKIYICTSNGSKKWHVIDKPNEKGVACNVIQHGVQLDGWDLNTMPNFPNYRLGPLKGSPCDTLIGVANNDIFPEYYHIQFSPNPASDVIKIDITLPLYEADIKTEVAIVDISGEIIQKYTMPDFAYLATIDISKLASGVYGVQLRQPKKFGERVLATQKLVVLR